MGNMTNDEKEAQAKKIAETFGIELDQVYSDNDPREGGVRFIRVLSTVSKRDKACCARSNRDGSQPGKTIWIRFDRLSNPKLFTKIK